MRGLVLSLFVHAGMLAAGLIYLPRAAQLLDATPVVPIEMVTIAETTNIRAAAPEPEPEPEETPEETIEDEIEAPAPAPEPEPEPVETEPEIIDIAPTEEPEPAPEPVEPEPEPEPEPEQPERQQTVQPEAPEETEPSLFDMLGNIERDVAEARQSQGSPEEGETRDAVGNASAMTATLRDLINSHIVRQRCWRMPLDAPYPEERVVTITMRLNRDGTLDGPPELDERRTRDRNDSFRDVIRERALRAAVECAPYPLPANQYNQWRLIRVNFGPDNASQQ